MILGSPDSEYADVMVLANSSKVGPQASLQFLCDRLAAILRAEYQVDVISGERVGQCAAPFATLTGLNAIPLALPGLPPLG